MQKAFEATRLQAGFHKLKRMAASQKLSQLVCSSAVTGQAVHDPDSLYGTGVIYRTAVLGDATIALRKAALSPTKHPNGDAGRLDRYEIAIWKTERSGSPMYWVGIETHDDSVHEFLARLLYTDHLFGLGYDSWKKVISPSCKSK